MIASPPLSTVTEAAAVAAPVGGTRARCGAEVGRATVRSSRRWPPTAAFGGERPVEAGALRRGLGALMRDRRPRAHGEGAA